MDKQEMFRIARNLGYEPINGEMRQDMTNMWMREKGFDNPEQAWEDLKAQNVYSQIWVEEYRDCVWLRKDLMSALNENRNR